MKFFPDSMSANKTWRNPSQFETVHLRRNYEDLWELVGRTPRGTEMVIWKSKKELTDLLAIEAAHGWMETYF